MAGGNNIATYSGDASHHLFLANNVYRQAYGNDRETMTYDDFGSAYYGGFTGVPSRVVISWISLSLFFIQSP